MIAEFTLMRSDDVFCCEDEQCDMYIKKGSPYVMFVIVEMNGNGWPDVYFVKKCIECSIEDITDDIEERTSILTRIENSI